MNVIIIEDELLTAKELQNILESLDSEIKVLAILTSVLASVKWLQENADPDLIFSDIQLGDGLSFEIFSEVKTGAPIIFCTAFDQYAIDAFESNSIDYLLKPIEDDTVERSLKKFKRIKEHYLTKNYANDLNKVITHMNGKFKQSILVNYREKMIPITVNDVCYCYAANGIVMLHSFGNQDYVVNYTIDQLESMLSPNFFFKVNRQFIINRNIIETIEHYFNRRLFVKTKCETPVKIIISRLKAQEFLNWVEC